MGFGYTGIRNERQWRATTGLSQAKFLELSEAFGRAYESVFGCSIEERQANSSQEAIFRSYEDLLFFVLFSLKSGLGYDALGAIFDGDGSTAKANQAFALASISFLTLTVISICSLLLKCAAIDNTKETSL